MYWLIFNSKPYARPQRRNARGQIWQDSSKQSWFQVTVSESEVEICRGIKRKMFAKRKQFTVY